GAIFLARTEAGGCYSPYDTVVVTVLASLNYYPDADNDGYGDAFATPIASCVPIPGLITDGTDCDDTDNTINPSATEVCGDGIDNDCDGVIENGCPYPSIAVQVGGNPVANGGTYSFGMTA